MIKKISIYIIALLICIILIQNTQVMKINILFWSISMSQIILLLVITLISFILGYLVRMILSKNKSAI